MTEYRNDGSGVMNVGGVMGNVVAGSHNQQTVSGPVTGDLTPVAGELQRLHQAVSAAAEEHPDDVRAVGEALEAARAGDRSRLSAALARTSGWVLRMAETIGVALVVKELSGLVQ